MGELRVGSIIQKKQGAPVSYTVEQIIDEDIVIASINSNSQIHKQPPFVWEGEYYKLADVYGYPEEKVVE